MGETSLAPCSPRALYHQHCERLGCRKNPVLLQVLPNTLNTFHLVTSIDLTGSCLGPTGCQALLEVIRLTPQLRSLALADNELDDGCVRQLLGILTGRKALTYLDLSGNCCGEGLGEELVQFVEETPTLQALQLRGSQVTDEHLDMIEDRLMANRKAASATMALGEAIGAQHNDGNPTPIILRPLDGEDDEGEPLTSMGELPEAPPAAGNPNSAFIAPWKRPPSNWLVTSGRVCSAPLVRTALPQCSGPDLVGAYGRPLPPRRPPSAMQRPSSRLGDPSTLALALRPFSAPRPGFRVSSANRRSHPSADPPPCSGFDGAPRWNTKSTQLDDNLDGEDQIDRLLADGQLVEQVASCLFKLADKTGSGTLSTIELAVVLHHTVVELSLLPPPPGEVRVVLETLDLGQAGTLTELEFIHAVRSYLLRRKRAANGGRPAISSLPSLVDRTPPRLLASPLPHEVLPAASDFEQRVTVLPPCPRRPSMGAMGTPLPLIPSIPIVVERLQQVSKRGSQPVIEAPEPNDVMEEELEQLLEQERRAFLEEDRQREEVERQRARLVLSQKQQLRRGDVTDFQCWMQEELRRLMENRPAPAPPLPPTHHKKGRHRAPRSKEGRGITTTTSHSPQEENREAMERFLKDVLSVETTQGPLPEEGPRGADEAAATPPGLRAEVDADDVFTP
eukprot:GGOE01036469.1.p1 GENE.GGOE01036469.1~~GGOE01036469.1.p1  ORF type:complete len:677 (-),score=150.04 GGOE01036469.1:234-2264(-)